MPLLHPGNRDSSGELTWHVYIRGALQPMISGHDL